MKKKRGKSILRKKSYKLCGLAKQPCVLIALMASFAMLMVLVECAEPSHHKNPHILNRYCMSIAGARLLPWYAMRSN